jgi:hypothetical protein
MYVHMYMYFVHCIEIQDGKLERHTYMYVRLRTIRTLYFVHSRDRTYKLVQCTGMYIHMYIHSFIHSYPIPTTYRMCIHMYICTYVCTYTLHTTHICTYVLMYVDTNIRYGTVLSLKTLHGMVWYGMGPKTKDPETLKRLE